MQQSAGRARPRLLVVTPTLGKSPYFAATVQSVPRRADVEHVVTCPADIRSQVAAMCDGCTVVAEPRPAGIYEAVNYGAAASADWDWFSYINDDDLLTPGFAAMATQHMAAGDENAIGYGDIRLIGAHDENLGLLPLERNQSHFRNLMRQGLTPLAQQGTLISRALFTRLGGFSQAFRHVSDFDFLIRALEAGARFQYYPKHVASWRLHESQASSDLPAVHEELWRVAGAVRTDASRFRLKLERWRFHLLNSRRYWERHRETGQWRMRGLFALTRGGDQG